MVFKPKNSTMAIIDSGFDVAENDFNKNVTGCIKIEVNGVIQENSLCQDENGHGSCCCAIAHKIAPAAQILMIKILNEDNKGSKNSLIVALRYLLTRDDVLVVNMSLAISFLNDSEELKSLCTELFYQGKYLVSSLANQKKTSIPAIYRNVIGVQGNDFFDTNKYWFNKSYAIQVVADCVPVFLKRPEKFWGIISGNSKATIFFASLLMNNLLSHRTMSRNELIILLEKNANRGTWKPEDICLQHKEIHNKNKQVDDKIFKDVLQLVGEMFHITDEKILTNVGFLHSMYQFDKIKAGNLIDKVAAEFKLNIAHRLISLYEISDVYSLTHFVLENST